MRTRYSTGGIRKQRGKWIGHWYSEGKRRSRVIGSVNEMTKGKAREWRFVIQHGLKTTVDHRRWTEDEIEFVREALVKLTIEEIAKKLHRTPQAIRSMLVRNHLGIRETRCDRFSVESLALALRVRTEEIRLWIDQGWLQATISMQGKRRSYIITPEALTLLYKEHLPKILHRGHRNQALFDAYFQYCYSPKHTLGEQLLDVRRDKRERAAFLALGQANVGRESEEEDDDREYHLDVTENIGAVIGNDTE
jgi:hypothetical protein